MKKGTLLVIILLSSMLAILFYFTFFQYRNAFVFNNNGFVFTSNQVIEKLYINDLKDKDSKIDYKYIKENEQVYLRGDKYYIGELDKEEIMINYPIISVDGIRVTNMNDTMTLINKNFQIHSAYANSILADGSLYNDVSYDKVDREEYFLLNIKDKIYLNSIEIKINNNVIPKNSIINFMENEIRYYYYDNESFKYNRIQGINKTDMIYFSNMSIEYEKFLLNLEIILKDDNIDDEIIDSIIKPKEDEIVGPVENEKIKYIKPEVNVKVSRIGVYSFDLDIDIIDPAGRIETNPSFELKLVEKTFMRKTLYSSGKYEMTGLLPNTEFKLIGYYTYRDDKDKLYKKTIIDTTITTKDITELEPLKLTYQNDNLYSNKIEFDEISLNNKKNSEVLKGIKTVEIKIGDDSFLLSNSDVQKLRNIKSVHYKSPEILNSNTVYDAEFIFYDVAGNILPIENSKLLVKTIKEKPSANITVDDIDLTKFTANIEIINNDDVALSDILYVLTDSKNNIIKKGTLDELKLIINDLNANEMYNLSIYADYDLGDNKGLQTNVLLSSVRVSTKPISTMGFVRFNLTEKEISQNYARYDLTINKSTTDSKLLSLLSKVYVAIKNKETEELVNTYEIEGMELEKLKNDEIYDFNISDLYSNTKYTMEFSTEVKQGTKIYSVNGLANIKEFMTLKQTATVQILNKFSTENLIDFDVKITDLDHAIESNRVVLYVKDLDETLISYHILKVNEDYERITFDKLEKETTYIFSYIAEEYNEGHNNSTYIQDKVLLEERISTSIGIYGSIQLDSLLKEITSDNLFDITNSKRWKKEGSSTINSKSIDIENNTLELAAKNGYATYSYFLPEGKSKKITVSFSARQTTDSNMQNVYLSNGGGGNKQTLLNNLNTEWKEYSFTITLSSNSYIGFYISEIGNNNTVTTMQIKDLEIELYDAKKVSGGEYKPYSEKSTYLATLNASIYDTKDELEKKEFILEIYRDNVLETSSTYEMEEPLKTENMLIKYHLEKNSNYEIRMNVNIRDRLYPITSAYFTTEEEIRVIKNINDFFAIHTTGKYLVAEDLDFRNSSKSIGFYFYGNIDFQGHKLLLDVVGAPSSLMPYISPAAVLTNIDAHFYLNNTSEKSNYYGLFQEFYGRVSNIKITVEESNNFGNVNYCLLAYVNRGIIENFVINNKAGFSAQRFASLAMMHNYGTLRNGYVYGENINATFPTTDSTKRIGSVAGYAGENSLIENVFSLIGIDVINKMGAENYEYDNRVGSIVGEHNRGTMRNIYSYTSGSNRELTRDANVGIYSYITQKNMYYVADDIFDPKFSLKVSKLALRDEDFQKIINTQNAFNIDDYVQYGYYPQIKWPSCMPNQEYLRFPTVDDSDLIDITNVKSTKQVGNTTEVTLLVNNPNVEKIKTVGIKNINTIEVLDQVTEKNTTILTLRLSNPTKYVSKYYIKSITAISALGHEYPRTYKDNERVILVDMYREIKNESEWLNIKTYPNENFILRADLNFQGMPTKYFYIPESKGIINGDGHTIRNIELTSGDGLINSLTGTVKNLNIENFKRTTDNLTDKAGVIGRTYSGSIIDNVHVKDITLYANNRMGGILGYSDATIITNSSVTDVKVSDLDEKIDVKIGGILGEGYNTTIENCFVQKINIDANSTKTVYGLGGIVGYLSSGSVINTYAVGEINTNSPQVGGLIGRGGPYISNSYSNVDITSSSDYIGGIIGDTTNTNIANSLSVGSLYSSLSSINVRRIVGNRGITNNNYAWDKQHINGKITALTHGEVLLTREELSDRLTYEEKINLGTDFNYDDIGNGKLPKLYNTNLKELLPNQEDNYLKSYSFDVLSINTYKTLNDVTVLMTIDNPNNYEIKDVVVDSMTGVIKKNYTSNGTSTVEVLLTPKRAYDSYRITKIIYVKDGIDTTYKTDVKIDAQFYKDIEKFEDWQQISTDYSENYRLINDIDFSGKTNINYNVMINRLEGTGDTKKVLKNISFTTNGSDQALIKSINSHISNIEFDNVTISNSKTNNFSRNGIILFAFGIFENVDFNDITLTFNKVDYVAPLVFDRTSDLRNVNLKSVDVKGKSYTSGFISRSTARAITNITMDDADIYGNGSYIGAIIANADSIWTPAVFHLTVTNSKIEGTSNYVGGALGYGGANYVNITNVSIKASGNYVGGVAGQTYNGTGQYLYVKDSEIHGNKYIGGISGYSYNLRYNYVDNTKIYGDYTTSIYVGGIVGYGGYSVYNSGVKNSTIESKGDYTGGIKGILSYATVRDSYVLDTTVTGRNYVGGIVGGHESTTNSICRCITNATVTATTSGAGGLLGYAANLKTDDASNKIYIYNNIVNATITAPTNSGGLVGRMDKLPYENHMYRNILAVNVNTTNALATPTLIIGSSDYYNTNIIGNKIYNGSTINGVIPTIVDGVTDQDYIDDAWLRVKKNYTNMGFSTSYFKYDKLATDYYPYLYDNVAGYNVYFKLPEINLEAPKNSFSIMQMTLESEELHLIPKFEIYASDINAFNIEFNNKDLLTTLNVNGDITKINQKVFTYNYDYKKDITIVLSDGVNEEKYVFKNSDISNKIYIDENKYYFIKNNKLITNNGEIKEKILNIYDGKALTEKGIIINLSDLKRIDNRDNTFYRRGLIKALYEFNYNNKDIQTYYNYSTLNNEELVNQLFVKNNSIEMITGGNNSYKQSIIIDRYNDKDYLVLLNKDGKLYNMKDKIVLPDKFDNKDILAMSNNINNDTNLIGIIYKNGGLLVFDYRNGKKIFSDYKNTDNLFTYYMSSFDNKVTKAEAQFYDAYDNSKKLIDKLNKKSIYEVINKEKNDESNEYISVYNITKKDYDIYDITELVNKKNTNVEVLNKAINNTINSSAILSNYYITDKHSEGKGIVNGILIFILILLGIIYSIIKLGNNIAKEAK